MLKATGSRLHFCRLIYRFFYTFHHRYNKYVHNYKPGFFLSLRFFYRTPRSAALTGYVQSIFVLHLCAPPDPFFANHFQITGQSQFTLMAVQFIQPAIRATYGGAG